MKTPLTLVFLAITALTANATPYILISDRDNDAIRKYSLDGTYLGDAVASGAGGLDNPLGLTVDTNGDIYVGGDLSGVVHKYNGKTGEQITTLSTQGMRGPAGLAFRNGMLHVADGRTGRISRFDQSTNAFVDNIAANNIVPEGMAWDNNGKLYVGDWWTHRIRVYDAITGAFERVLVTRNGLDRPLHMKISDSGDSVYTMNLEGDTLTEHSIHTGDLIRTVDLTANNSPIDGPVSWITLTDGSHLVSSSETSMVLQYNADWEYEGIWAQGDGLLRPNAMVYVVPAAPSASLLGLAGFIATRRRR